MTRINTSCENCYFASEAESEKPCTFFIPDAIQETKKIEVKNSYYYLNDYQCRYGVSKETYNNKIKDMDIDIIEYAKAQAIPRYILYVYIKGDDLTLRQVCDNINKLAVRPEKIKIAFDHTFNVVNAADICEELLGKKFNWKLHYFFDEQPDYNMLNVAITNDNVLTYSKFIWILDHNLLDYIVKNNLDNSINFIVNVQQPPVAILNSKKSTGYFYGMFMTLDNLMGIWSHVSKDISKAIEESYKDSISYYD